MKTIRGLILTMLWLSVVPMGSAATTYYVSDLTGNDTNNGAGWDAALKTITNGLSRTSPGDTVLVSNGVYYSQQPIVIPDIGWTNVSMIFLTNMATLKSVNGAANTIIDGNYLNVTNRCIYMDGTGVLDGFTIRGGRAIAPDTGKRGGGVYMQGTGGIVRCCIIESNYCNGEGGGIGVRWTKTPGALIENCIIRKNSAYGGAGGVTFSLSTDNCKIRNCLIINNTVDWAINAGAGMTLYSANYVQNCTIVSNYFASGSGGAGGLWSSASFVNYISNSIIYYNRSEVGSNNCAGTNACYGYNCTYPLVDGARQSTNNITNEPLFQAISTENCRLNANSPCINRGANQDWMTNAVDLDGRTRIRYGTVDMGAYELIYEGTIYKLW